MKYWLLILMLLPGVAAAGAFKCRDESGGTVYSTSPCEDNPGLVPFIADPAGSDGSLILHPSADRTFRIQGEVNGAPLTFVLDTSAVHSAMSPDAASAAGVQGCDAHAARRCSVSVHEVTFGGFELNDVVVDVTPDLPADVRLGANALKQLSVKQTSGALHISRK